jgi:flavin-dependent dehydrogenase
MSAIVTDLAIVGAGSAGAALAGHAARAGMRVMVLERRPIEEAGARWVNGVARWMFEESGIAAPSGSECVGQEGAFHLVAGRDARARIVVRDHDVIAVDMRRLVSRLQSDAREAGADLRGGTNVFGFESGVLRTGAGDIRARYFVDASGLTGARLMGQPRVVPADICAAAQEMRRIRDLPAARAWFERHDVLPGDGLCFTAVAGGYSILNVRLDGDAVSILTGSIPALGYPSGARILADFVAEQPWVGERIFGAAWTLPLRRPYDSIVDGRVALVGDAACQVFSAHGSGVGIGLIAARLLADALVGRGGLDRYALAFHRRWGGLLAGYDIFRRFSQTMDASDVATLMRAGLLDETGVREGMSQRLPRLTPSLAVPRLVASARAPVAAGRFLGVLARMGVAKALFANYPATPSRRRVWSRIVARAIGDPGAGAVDRPDPHVS